MNATAILVGGVIPAVFLGLGTVLMRASIGAGATVAMYLAIVGTTIAGVGWAAVLVGAGGAAPVKASLFAGLMGLTWSIAIACIAYGFGVLKLPVAVVAPLTNSNALVALAVGAIAFGEWNTLDMVRVTIGAVLVCAGATVVSLSR